jgi:hypothetical protein
MLPNPPNATDVGSSRIAENRSGADSGANLKRDCSFEKS